MDRGVRIAIVAACLLSLGLGLIWDSVIETTRDIIVDSKESNDMGPDPAVLSVGNTKLPAPERPEGIGSDIDADSSGDGVSAWLDANDVETISLGGDAGASSGRESTPSSASTIDFNFDSSLKRNISGGYYTVQGGDGWWKIANNTNRFKPYGQHMHESGKWSDSSEFQQRWKDANPEIVKKRGDSLMPGDKLKIPQ